MMPGSNFSKNYGKGLCRLIANDFPESNLPKTPRHVQWREELEIAAGEVDPQTLYAETAGLRHRANISGRAPIVIRGESG